MANYGLKTETTTHLAGMQVVNPETGGGVKEECQGLRIVKILKSSSKPIYGYESPDFKDASVYFCNCKGRYGLQAEHAVILIHPDITDKRVFSPDIRGNIEIMGGNYLENARYILLAVICGFKIPSNTVFATYNSLEGLLVSDIGLYDITDVEPLELSYDNKNFSIYKIAYFVIPYELPYKYLGV